MNKADIKIFKAAGAQLPVCQTEKAAGFDFHAHLEGDFKETGKRLEPMERALIGTGIFMDLGDNEMQIRPRSGLAFSNGITVLNSPGTIDGDYRGEIKILLINLGQEAFTIKHGERIAQGVISKVTQPEWTEVHSVNDLEPSERGAGGFGSTGSDKAKEYIQAVRNGDVAKKTRIEYEEVGSFPDMEKFKAEYPLLPDEAFQTGPIETKKEVTAEEAKAEAGALEADYEVDETINTFGSIGLVPSDEVLAEVKEDFVKEEPEKAEAEKTNNEERRIVEQPVSGGSGDEEPVAEGNGQKVTGKRRKASKKSSGK